MYRSLPTERVSVVIPVRDDSRYLERCLDALAMQTYPPFEVIVVDNGSVDGSAELAARRVARVVRENEVGIPAASAAGYDAAQGDLIARLDADSIPGATWISSVCESFARNTNAAAVTGGGMLMEDDGRPHRRASRFFMRAYFSLVGLALGHPPLWGSALAMRREAWQQVRLDVCRHDPRVHDDIDLSIHLGPERRIVFDRTLNVAVSARPLAFDRAALDRFGRGFYTIVHHWPQQFPALRMVRRARAERQLESGQSHEVDPVLA